MDLSGRFFLKWGDFTENAIITIKDLQNDEDFSDVTLVCDGTQQIKAHKFILASSSSFFGNILKTNIHPHPLIYIKGISSQHLLAIVDFMYQGEVKIYQEDLSEFLAIAEDLQLRGLVGREIKEPEFLDQDSVKKKRGVKKESIAHIETVLENENIVTMSNIGIIENDQVSETENIEFKSISDTETFQNEYIPYSKTIENEQMYNSKTIEDEHKSNTKNLEFESISNTETVKNYKTIENPPIDNMTTMVQECNTSQIRISDMSTIDAQIKSMIDRVYSTTQRNQAGSFINFMCKVCKKLDTMQSHIMEHIESNHILGLKVPCTECGKHFRTRSGLRHHTRKHHIKSLKTPQEKDITLETDNIVIVKPKIRPDKANMLSCDVCARLYSSTDSLRVHKHSVHRGKKFPCDMCEYVTNGQAKLGYHREAIHIKEQLFPCDQCDYKTSRRYNLRNHNRRKHEVWVKLKE